MSVSRTEENDISRKVEGEEQTGGANPWQDIPLNNVPPPVKDAPQAVVAEQSEGVPKDAEQPEDMTGHLHPENPIQAGNSPNQQNEIYEGEAGKSTEEIQIEPSSKNMRTFLLFIMWGIILYLTLGTVIFSALKFTAQNETTSVTDVNLNMTTPMTTSIFNVNTIVDDNMNINAPEMDV